MEGSLRLLAVLLSGVVLLSFGMFAVDESHKGSDASQAGIADAGVSVPGPGVREPAERHGGARRAVDRAADALRSPFRWTSPASAGAWRREGVPTLLALLFYGFGLAYLARFTHARS